MWNLVKKRTFCKKLRPLKKKGQNVSFRELKDEKRRVDSPGYYASKILTNNNGPIKAAFCDTIWPPWPHFIKKTYFDFIIWNRLFPGATSGWLSLYIQPQKWILSLLKMMA